jgi:hypothetical protein
MGQSMTQEPPRLSRSQFEILCRRVRDAADRMSDDQILSLADSLHDALRERRKFRDRVRDQTQSGAANRLPN